MKKINNFKNLLRFLGKKNLYTFNQRLQRFQFKADEYSNNNLLIKNEDNLLLLEKEEENKNLVEFKNKKDFRLFLTSMENSQILLKNMLKNNHLLDLDLLFLTIKQLKNNFKNFDKILSKKKQKDLENEKLDKNYKKDILIPFSSFIENYIYLKFLELAEKILLEKLNGNFEKCSFVMLLLFDFDFRNPSKKLINKWLDSGLYTFSENNDIDLEGQEWILKLGNKFILNRKKDFKDLKKLENFFFHFNDFIYENFEKYGSNQKIIFLINFENAKKIVNFKNLLLKKIDYDLLNASSNLKINTLFKLLKIFEENNKNNLVETLVNKINNKIKESNEELKIDNIYQITEIFEKKKFIYLQNTIIDNFHRFIYLDNYEFENKNPNNILFILNFYLKQTSKKDFLSESLIEYISENFLLLNSDFYDFENFIEIFYTLTLNNFYSEKFLNENFVFYIKDLFQKKIMLLEDKHYPDENFKIEKKNYLFLYLDLLWAYLTNNYNFLEKNDFINHDVSDLLINLKKENWNLLKYDNIQKEKMKQINFYLSKMGLGKFFDIENNLIFEKNKNSVFYKIIKRKFQITKNIINEQDQFFLLYNDLKIPIFIMDENFYFKTIENYIDSSVILKMNKIGKTKLEIIKNENKNYLIITIKDFIENNYELFRIILKDDHFLKRNDFDVIIDEIQNDKVFENLVQSLKKRFFDIEKKEKYFEIDQENHKIPEIEDEYPVSDDEDYK